LLQKIFPYNYVTTLTVWSRQGTCVWFRAENPTFNWGCHWSLAL